MERVSVTHLSPSGWLTLQGNAAVLGTELRGTYLGQEPGYLLWEVLAQPLLLPPWPLLLGLLRKHWGGWGKSLTSTDLYCCSLDDREAPLQWMPLGFIRMVKNVFHTLLLRGPAIYLSLDLLVPSFPDTVFSRSLTIQVNHYPLTRTQYISTIWVISQCRWRRQSNVLVLVVSPGMISLHKKYSGMLFLGDIRLK